jgi:hypothetical protein
MVDHTDIEDDSDELMRDFCEHIMQGCWFAYEKVSSLSLQIVGR